MIKRLKQRISKHTRLSSLITRSIFITLATLALIVLVQSYQFNRQVIFQEIDRSLQQTSSLVQAIFSFRLNAIEIQQDSYSRSDVLVQALDQSSSAIDSFFTSADQMAPALSPDFRFITKRKSLHWDDSNYQFYGIPVSKIEDFVETMSLSNNWHLISLKTDFGLRYIMMRRTPIIDLSTGEVLASLHVGIVLNNNFSLASAVKHGSNTDNVVIAVGSKVVASTVRDNENYTSQDLLDNFTENHDQTRFLIAKTDIAINAKPTFISIYSIQNNEHVALLTRSHYFWLFIAFVSMFVLAVSTRFWLGRKVSQDLTELMNYTVNAVEHRKLDEYKGSSISEFQQIGEALELTFQRLTNKERQFQDLFNFSLLPIMFWDMNGRVMKMNPAAERYFNSSEVDDNTYQIMLEKLLPQIQMASQGATLTGVNIPLGDQVFRWNLSPIVFDDTPKMVVAQGQDITSLVEAERQSQQAREEAEESARVRADFLAKMSHELRTPLNGILGVSQLLKAELRTDNEKEHVDVLINSGEHLLAVLNDILDFSKLEQGKFHIQQDKFRLMELKNTVSKIFAPLCEEKGIHLNVNDEFADDIHISSDQVRLNQILINLVSNSVKFTHSGSVKVKLALSESNEKLHINVTDTGIGIDQNRIDSIFEPFVQAESTITREYGGSGLGLTIVQNLVELLGGSITVDSEKGKGSCFCIAIPVTVSSQASSLKPTIDPEMQKTLFSRKLSVLLVEDNHTNAFIAQAFCLKYGMDVEWVTDGNQAISTLSSHKEFDLILMDNQLPNLGGIETTKTIREKLSLSTPIYACTADGMQETKEAFIAAGANYIIIKPIKEKALHEAFVHFKENFV